MGRFGMISCVGAAAFSLAASGPGGVGGNLMWVCPADSARNVSLYHNFRAVDRCDDGGWRLDVPASVGRLNTFSVFGVWFPDSKPGDLTYMSVTDSEGDASGLNRSGMASGDVSVQLPWPGGSAVVSCMRRAVAGHRSFWTPANDASLSTGHVSGASGFSGCVGDVALFSRVLSPFECARVESSRVTRHIFAGSTRVISTVGDARTATGLTQAGDQARNGERLAASEDSVAALFARHNVPFARPDLTALAVAALRASGITAPESYFYHGDHLGNTTCMTNRAGAVTQHTEYLPFGEPLIEQSSASADWQTSWLFNSKEYDPETGLYYYGARYYDPALAMWLSPDPLQEKYPNSSSYCALGNNPLCIVDNDGREGIVVSGSPGSHDNKLHFLINGLDRAKKAKKYTNGSNVTWIIYNDVENGFLDTDLKNFEAQAKSSKIKVRIVSSVTDIIEYINNKNGGVSRDNDLITAFYYVGHATPGDLDVGYSGTSEHFDPSDLRAESFSRKCHVNVVGGCRTAVPHLIFGFIEIERSIVDQFSEILDISSEIYGSDVRVDYLGGVMSDESLLRTNKGKIVKKTGNLK